MASPREASAPGASTRNSGIDISARSKVACSTIVGMSPKRRKISAQTTAGRKSSTKREYDGKPG